PVGDFALGSMYSTAAIHLPPRLAEYHRRYPAVNLQLQTAPSGELVESLLGGRLDAVLVDGPLDFDGLEGLPMFEERMVLVTENGHPPVRGPEDVAGSAVIAFRPRCSYRLLLESWFASARVSMGRVMEIESYHSMLACVVAGGGVALMPVSMLQSLPGRESVAVHALAEPFARASTWLVWRKGMVGANLKAWIGLLQGRESALA
ncbi:TPA: LysR family transcriptional regulator, partial [Pseudomonas aeruginosa]|nr:LysR family transcriptional regulator [Pseudomonas aeruginosa]